jgi:hypothetical protein
VLGFQPCYHARELLSCLHSKMERAKFGLV